MNTTRFDQATERHPKIRGSAPFPRMRWRLQHTFRRPSDSLKFRVGGWLAAFELPVSNRLGQVYRIDQGSSSEIGNRPRDFQYAVMGARRQR